MAETQPPTVDGSELTLIGLPREVRDRILLFALPSAGQESFNVCRHDESNLANNNPRGSGKCPRFQRRSCPGIVLVNKQISQECVTLLHQTPAFGFCSVGCLRTFSDIIRPSFAHAINKVSCKRLIPRQTIGFGAPPLSMMAVLVYHSLRRNYSAATWRTALTLDFTNPDHLLATFFVEKVSDTTGEEPKTSKFNDVEVFDINSRCKKFIGSFHLANNFDEEVFEARDQLLIEEALESVDLGSQSNSPVHLLVMPM